jgi:hypothetical protein
MSCNTHLHRWFEHDGVLPHYSHEVHRWLFRNYPGYWIGRKCEAAVSRPACSPNLHPHNLFLWGYLKTKFCPSTVDTREELWRWIQQFASEVWIRPESSNGCKFHFYLELICVSLNVEVISSSCCSKIKIEVIIPSVVQHVLHLTFNCSFCSLRYTLYSDVGLISLVCN